MSASNPDFSLAFVVLVVAAAAFATIALRRAIRARNLARRTVEQPNSHYTSPVVRNGETRHRWQSIDLENIHEVNRGEVKLLLARVEASGVDSLRENERVFLDQFPTKAAAPKPAPLPRETGRPMASDLRHRPA